MDRLSNWAIGQFQLTTLSHPALAGVPTIAGDLYRDGLLVEQIQIPYDLEYVRSVTPSTIVFRRELSDLINQDIVTGRFEQQFPDASSGNPATVAKVGHHYAGKTQEWLTVEFGDPEPGYEAAYPNAKARVVADFKLNGPK